MLTRIVTRGLLAGLPLILTIAVLVWLLKTIEHWLAVPLKYLLAAHYVPGMGLLLGVVLTIFLGIIASTLIGRRILRMINNLIERLPLIKTIYSSLEDIFRIFRRTDADSFQKAVIVEWGGRRFLGFVTRDDTTDLPDGLMEDGDIVVYLPMGYQIGGFPIVVARDQVKTIDMSADAALRFALTAGLSTTKTKT